MMFQWTPDMIRFMRDASEYNQYHQKLTAQMLPWLNRDTNICDAGCGLGDLSLALAPHVGQVTAVDIDPRPLRALEERCRTRGISNIDIRCGDISGLAPAVPYDTMVFCFFGSIEEICSTAKQQCRGSVFVISKNYTSHRFSVGDHRNGDYGFSRAKKVIMQQGISFEEKEMEIELGQPFRSFDDARLFFLAYSRDTDKSVITDEFLRQKLVCTDDTEFPFYMPHLRKVGWLKFDVRDIPG